GPSDHDRAVGAGSPGVGEEVLEQALEQHAIALKAQPWGALDDRVKPARGGGAQRGEIEGLERQGAVTPELEPAGGQQILDQRLDLAKVLLHLVEAALEPGEVSGVDGLATLLGGANELDALDEDLEQDLGPGDRGAQL